MFSCFKLTSLEAHNVFSSLNGNPSFLSVDVASCRLSKTAPKTACHLPLSFLVSTNKLALSPSHLTSCLYLSLLCCTKLTIRSKIFAY